MTLPPANQEPCRRCGQRGAHRHERLPRSRGGPRDAFNSVILCAGCHHWVHHSPAEARMEGWTVPGSLGRDGYVGVSAEYREHYGDGRRDRTQEAL